LLVGEHDVCGAPPLGLRELAAMFVVVGPHLAVRDAGGRRQLRARQLFDFVPEHLTDSLLDFGALVEAPAACLAGQELGLDDLVEQLSTAIRRLVTEPLELIHALERGGVFTEGDLAIPDFRQYLAGELRRELPRRGAGRRARARRLLRRFPFAPREHRAAAQHERQGSAAGRPPARRVHRLSGYYGVRP
jgi:hypothetical protein